MEHRKRISPFIKKKKWITTQTRVPTKNNVYNNNVGQKNPFPKYYTYMLTFMLTFIILLSVVFHFTNSQL